MAITFVGSYVGTHAATSAQTVNFSNLRDEANAQPTLQEGDLVLVAVENASTVDRTQAQLTPSGYTALHTDDYRNDSNDSNFLVSRKFMGSTPDTSVAIPASNATTAGVAYAIYVFRGVNQTEPMDATPVVTGNINTGVANAAAITPVTAGAWIVVFGGAAVAAGAVFTNPAGMSTTTNHFRSATITTTTNDANIGGAIYTAWTSGSYDPAAFGGSTSTNTGSWSAVTLALRPVVDHAATGVLGGQEAVVAGSAARASASVSHDATGVLTGQGSTIAGSANRTRVHASTGVLSGQGSTVSGSANRTRQHAATGVLSGQGSSVAGAANRTRQHASTGALTGQGSALSGSASRSAGAVTHDATGSLAGQGASLSGSANRTRVHASTAVLTGQGAQITGISARIRIREASGALVGQGATINGTAARSGLAVSHDAIGALVGQGSTLSGAAAIPDGISVQSGPYAEEETTTAGNWTESLTTSGTYSQTQTTTSGSQGQGLSVTSGNWSEAA